MEWSSGANERKKGVANLIYSFLSSIRKDMKTRSLKQVTLNPTRIVDNAKSELIEKMASRPQNFLTHSEYIELLRTITPHLVILRRYIRCSLPHNIHPKRHAH
ncbi:hypothetical protein BLNAU_22580 [Blattamonas nauphoetae]|uniref:Uncharacterized protein n=1 Tax=Blattamonas nauphoetae TaxID=2049346 RepID=A0ABQ9WSM4_9EUKA|nr:hypothetical protein BLNAU_22580 [Blattamonas nauphoetae]